MSRVDDLQKKYPGIPRDFIVRWDTKVHGIRDTGSLDRLGVWVRLAGGAGSYATYDEDITLKDWVAAKEGRQKDGHVLRPCRFILRNGMDIDNRVSTRSDLEIRDEGSGSFAIYQGDDRVEQVYHIPRKGGVQYLASQEEQVTRSGKPVSNFVSWASKYCFIVVPVRHCEYFPLGVECKFCSFNSTQDDAHSVGLERSTTINVEETLEAYKMHASEVRVVEGRFVAGAFTNLETEARIYTSYVERMAGALPYKPNLKITSQPLGRRQMQRLKDVGLDNISFQMEIWDPELFAEAVPGKSQYVGRDRYLEAFQEAVDILGVGNVECIFVGGLSMMPENGHATWQEGRDSLIEGNTWMIRHGVLPIFTALRLPPGAAYGKDEYRKRRPPTDYYLDAALAHHEAMKEYDRYATLNKLIACPIECLNANYYCFEFGIYEVAGSFANWAADAIPREANWWLDWEEEFASILRNQ